MIKNLVSLSLCLCLCFSLAKGAQALFEREVPQTQQQVQLSYAPLVKKTAPAVVNIYTKRTEKVELSPLFNDPLMKLFMGDALRRLGVAPERVVSSLGSGVIVRPEGLIITNNHVIQGSDEIRIVLNDRREFDAELIATDEQTDLAVLRVRQQGLSLPYLRLNDSDRLEVGDLVLAIGNPFGIGQTVTSGIVSALARTSVGATDYQFFIQTDAAINPGNSGGALVTMDGNLVGVNTAIYSRSGGSNGIGFAIPANLVRTVVDSIEKRGRIVRPWLGAAVQTVTSDIAQSLGMERTAGVILSRIYEGGPADRAGLIVGDIIIAMDGYDIQDAQALRYRVVTFDPTRPAEVRFIRQGRVETTRMQLEYPPYDPEPDERRLEGRQPLAGSVVANLSPALALELGLDMNQRGVAVLGVVEESLAASYGVQRGDIILQVNRTTISSSRELAATMATPTRRWQVVVERAGRRLSLDVAG